MRKIILISAIALLTFAMTGMAKAVPPSNLVGWWQFEGNANDSSSYRNNGTVVGTINYVTGKIGNAISLDGASGKYIEVPDANSLDLDTVTLEAWIQISNGDVGSGQRNIVRKGHFGDRTYGLDTVVSGSNRVLRGWVNVGTTGGATAKIVTGKTNLADGKWHHVAMTYDKSSVKIFVDGSLEGTFFSATADIYDNNLSVRIGGQNPKDNGGALVFKGLIDEVRIWNVALSPQEFNDGDLDGVKDDVDKCQETKKDPWNINGSMIGTAGYLGVNRHMWNGSNFVTLISKTGKGGKTNFSTTTSEFTMEYTYGCSCEQILNTVTQTLGFEMEGHYKFGCSKSVIESWHEDWEDGLLDGKKYIGDDWVLKETVQVPANGDTPVTASTTFENGAKYNLKAYGTAWACNQEGCHVNFDAEYSTNYDGTQGWINGVEQYESWGENLLDLKVNGEFVDWGAFNSDHIYYYELIGTETSATFEFVIYDIYYPNNTGYISVDIYKLEPQYISLW